MRIPFVDLKRNYLLMKDDIDAAIRAVLDSGYFILGDRVREFEKAFAAYCGVGYGCAVASGTDALHLALRACEVQPGDEVITVANTCVPTIAGITMAGALPVFVDIDPGTFTMDPARIEGAITPRTRAILPVHLYGRCADMTPILEIARRHGIQVVEDCAQAHGATCRGVKAGAWGDAGCFSFYPTKNLGAMGDAGMVVSKDSAIVEQVRMLRSYGESERYHHQIKGFNSRLDEIQAAILLVKLRHLDAANARRRDIAGQYRRGLENSGLRFAEEEPDFAHIHHLFVVRAPARDALRSRLGELGVQTLVHYPTPIHRQPAYREFLQSRFALKETERACGEIVSLPLYPEMTEAEVSTVIGACRKAMDS